MKNITSLVAAGAMLINVVAPVAAAEFYITGNGSDSTSDVVYTQTNSNSVVQNNNTQVKNTVKIDADTGDNNADDNTGGEVTIETGDADVKVKVDNMLNSNVAEIDSCGSCMGDSKIVIDGNGTGSDNDVEMKSRTTNLLEQRNTADVENDVDVEAETGENSADDNTGGDVTILTGDVDVEVYATTEANSNMAKVGGDSSNPGAGVEVMMTGNGSETDNDASITLAQVSSAIQSNKTSILNDLDVDGETGENTADDNTGGNVGIGSGDVDMMVDVWNEAGFNYFDAGDCCVEGVFAKIADNGTDTENEIEGTLRNENVANQRNVCGEGEKNDQYCFDNALELEGETGENDAEDNTGDSESDPVILTGDSDVEVYVTNEGGSNVIGETDPVDGLSLGEDLSVSISFDLGALLSYLGL